MNELAPEELVVMENEKIEQAVEFYFFALKEGWDRLTVDETLEVEKWKDYPYFKELVNEHNENPNPNDIDEF
jgi:hypothetical protein